MPGEGEWGEPADTLSAQALHALLAGTIPAIHLAQFATPGECETFCRALHADGVAAHAASTSPMTIVGGNLSNFRGKGKADYFARVEEDYRTLATLVSASFDPLARMLARLASAWPGTVAVATEREPRSRYFAGGVKSRAEGSALHFDYAPYLLEGYEICGLVDQISWNLYLEVPHATGETTVYDAMVRVAPQPRAPGAWNNRVAPEAVAGAARHTFRPRVGEAVLFNTRYPHCIRVESLAPEERRTQVGSFIGRMPDDALVLWS